MTARHPGGVRLLARARTAWALALGLVLAVTLLTGCALKSSVGRAPTFALENQFGQTTRLTDFRGRPVVITFLYTTCTDTCPIYLAKIAAGLQSRSDLGTISPAVVVVSVDPDRDTVAQLRYYASRWPRGWIFLTGSYEQMARVWASYRVTVSKRPPPGSADLGMSYTVVHTTKVVVIDASGTVQAELAGSWAPDDLAIALREAARSSGGLSPNLPLVDLSWLLRRCGEFAATNPAFFLSLVVLAMAPVLIVSTYLFRTFVK